jgi:Ca2+-binding RTX toxin-like protein
MRKTILVLTSVDLAVLLAGGVALAANIKGTGGNDVLEGTPSRDVLIPFDGNDTLRGGRGNDVIYGGAGRDLIDCAYLETRSGDTGDTAYYTPGEDTVVDCPAATSYPSDPTNPTDSTDPTDPTYIPPSS